MNITDTKGHRTKETNYAKLTPNTKLKARINPKILAPTFRPLKYEGLNLVFTNETMALELLK